MISCLPTIATAASRMRAGQLTAAELVEFCLAQIDRDDAGLRAWVLVDAAGARSMAERLDELGRRGQWRGPLHGVPVGVKDIVDVAGLPTRAGSPLREGHVADRDAPVITRLRQAGAIILGKTVTTQFACFDPAPTRNPWNENHTPGGSSSGSAAAVARQMCFTAIGSQTGGSIVRPASYCGVAGFKPSFGAVSLRGVVPVSPHLDHLGPLARTVADLTAMFAAMVTPGVLTAEAGAAGSAPKLHPIAEFFRRAEAETAAVIRAAHRRLERHTTPADAFRLPASFAEVPAMHRRLMAADAAEHHQESFAKHRGQYAPQLADLIDEGLHISAVDYARAIRHQQSFRAEIAERFASPDDFAVMPSTPATAPASLDTTGDPSFNLPWSYAGLPTVTLPCGFDMCQMPCGLQLIGGPGSDLNLLRTAAWCEKLLAENEHE